MRIVEVTERNIADAGFVHSESWKESHRSFCSAEFVEKHSPSAQTDYLRREMNSGGHIFMLIDRYPVAIAALNGLDMNEAILEKDRAASVKYNHRTNLEQFIVDMRDHKSDG